MNWMLSIMRDYLRGQKRQIVHSPTQLVIVQNRGFEKSNANRNTQDLEESKRVMERGSIGMDVAPSNIRSANMRPVTGLSKIPFFQ